MCLNINRKIHNVKNIEPSGNKEDVLKKYPPFVAPYNILVWKLLRKRFNGVLYTPWMNINLNIWNNGQCVMKDALGVSIWLDAENNPFLRVSEGIHAFYINGDNMHTAIINNEILFDKSCQLKAFRAIIPKGAKFYIGDRDEIVSNELHIYLDKSILPKEYNTVEQFLYENGRL